MSSIFVERNLQNANVSQFLFHSDYTIYRFEVNCWCWPPFFDLQIRDAIAQFFLSLPSPCEIGKFFAFKLHTFTTTGDWPR